MNLYPEQAKNERLAEALLHLQRVPEFGVVLDFLRFCQAERDDENSVPGHENTTSEAGALRTFLRLATSPDAIQQVAEQPPAGMPGYGPA